MLHLTFSADISVAMQRIRLRFLPAGAVHRTGVPWYIFPSRARQTLHQNQDVLGIAFSRAPWRSWGPLWRFEQLVYNPLDLVLYRGLECATGRSNSSAEESAIKFLVAVYPNRVNEGQDA